MVCDIVDNLDSVLSPGGMILWYDIRYPSPSNPHVRAMTLGRIIRIPGDGLGLRIPGLLRNG